MNQVVKDKWVTRLRSDQDVQGFNCLCTTDGKKCCLGALTDIYIEEYGLAWQDEMTGSGQPTGSKVFEEHWGSLPAVVQQWSGLNDDLPMVEFGGGPLTLSYLNDKEGLTFEQIADIIEAQL